MTEENLKRLKEEYKNYHEAKIEYDELNNKKDKLQLELKEMENNEIIKQYLIKKGKFDAIESDIVDLLAGKGRYLKYSEETLLVFIGATYYSNDIYVCVGEFPEKYDTKYGYIYLSDFKSKQILPINSNDSIYRAYIDIESRREMIILKSRCNDFENRNMVLYPNDEDPFDFFERVRLIFFKTCVDYNQEKAIAKVLELRKGK